MFRTLVKAVDFGAGYLAWMITYPLLYSKEGRKLILEEIPKFLKEHPRILEELREAMSLTILADATGDSLFSDPVRAEIRRRVHALSERDKEALRRRGKEMGMEVDAAFDEPPVGD